MFFKQFDSRPSDLAATKLLQIQNIRLSGVSKESNSIGLDLNSGEIHAVMGESGAGKTGLAQIMAGLKNPESGMIFIGGREVEIKNSFESLALGIGVLYDNINSSYIPHLSVKEYLYLWT